MTIFSKKIDEKNKIFKKHVKSKDTTRKKQLLNEFKELKNEITFLTREGKKGYYEKYFSKNQGQSKENMRGDHGNYQH